MLSQQNRIGRLTTPMGPDVLCLVELQAREGLSQLFDFDVVAIAEDANLDTEALIGKPCAVEVDAGSAGGRWFHGLVTEGEWNEQVEEFSYYRLRLRPWCWLLTKTADCRIHHDKTVVQIIRDTFADHGFSDYKLVLTQSYPTLHYTVQYCEDDWSFVCRLMELHGIYYFFEYAADKHTLVLADAYAAHAAEKPARALQFNASGAQALVAMRKPYVSRWSPRRRLRSGRFEITDYNHLTPTASQLSARPNPHNYAHGHFEVFDWPGPHVNREQGDAYVRVLTEAEEAQDGRRTAAGVAASVFPGVLVQLGEHPRAAENGEYLTVEMKSQFGPQEYRSRVAAPDGGFTAEYEFQPSAKPFRAPLETPKPLVHSLQTATVVGQEGEEIDCDDHGRILVHFFWDRHGDKSCRVRVNQVWGGQNWGAQVIPRIGMEVLVAYIDGDPDRPIVVGTAPNPQTLTVPYELPTQKTRMVWRSNSYKSSGRNEFTMEDMTEQQNFFTHSQKDSTHRILNNHTQRVDANHVTSVGANQAVNVASNQKTEVGGSMNLVVGGTGAQALALMGPLAGLAPQTAGLLQQSGEVAGGGGGAALGGMAMSVASSALGFFSGGGLSGLGGVTSGPDPTQDAGDALRTAGAAVGQDVGGILSAIPGMFNSVIGSFNTRSVGISDVQQIGMSKVTNVGQVSLENVGKYKKIAVGEEFVIECGDSKFVMKKDGTVLILGTTFNFIATGHFQMRGRPIDNN